MRRSFDQEETEAVEETEGFSYVRSAKNKRKSVKGGGRQTGEARTGRHFLGISGTEQGTLVTCCGGPVVREEREDG